MLCKDCVHFSPYHCEIWDRVVGIHDYCSNGRKKDADPNQWRADKLKRAVGKIRENSERIDNNMSTSTKEDSLQTKRLTGLDAYGDVISTEEYEIIAARAVTEEEKNVLE